MNYKTISIISFLLISVCTFAQKQQLTVTNTVTSCKVIFNEGKRVRIKTINGNKLSGKLFFTNDGNICIKSQVIAIDKIAKIKKNPLLLSIVTCGTCVFAGNTLIVAGLTGAAFAADTAALLAIFPGSGLIYLGIHFPNPIRGYKMINGWKLSITGNNTL